MQQRLTIFIKTLDKSNAAISSLPALCQRTYPQHESDQENPPQNQALLQASLRLMALLELAKYYTQL